MSNVDHYDFWRARLDGRDPGEPDKAAVPFGFWRLRDNAPLAVWLDGFDGRRAVIGLDRRALSAERDAAMAEAGSFGVAVSHADYIHAIEKGHWPDLAPAGRNGAGPLSNAPPSEFETLKEEIAAAVALAEGILAEAAGKDRADKLGNVRNRLGELGKRADELRVEEKRPHDEAAKAVQAKWKPLVDEASAAANRIRDALTAWMRAEEARLRAEEAARRQAEAEAAKAFAVEDEPPPAPPPPAPAPKVQAGGGYGRKTGFRTVKSAEITDYDALLAALKDNAEVRDLVQRLADRVAKAGTALPGMKIVESRVAA